MQTSKKIQSKPFNSARAKEIWEQRGPQNDLSKTNMTPEEILYVDEVWENMKDSESCCWMSAFFEILNNKI